jgi:hypothetical protein
MAIRLSALNAGRALPSGGFFVFISAKGYRYSDRNCYMGARSDSKYETWEPEESQVKPV